MVSSFCGEIGAEEEVKNSDSDAMEKMIFFMSIDDFFCSLKTVEIIISSIPDIIKETELNTYFKTFFCYSKTFLNQNILNGYYNCSHDINVVSYF